MVDAVVAPAVADAETPVVEAADVDAAADRVERRRTHVDVREQVNAPDGLVHSESPDDFGSVRHALELREKFLLFVPGLLGRVGDRLLAKHKPFRLDLVFPGKLLLVFCVPALALRVEVRGLESADLDKRHRFRGSCHEHVAVVATPLEHLLRRQSLAEFHELVFGVDDALARLGDLLGRDEILAENRASELVIRHLRREATDAGHDAQLKVPALLEKPLQAILVGRNFLESAIARVLDETAELLFLVRRDPCGHRRSPLSCQIRSDCCDLSLTMRLAFYGQKFSYKKLVS